VTKVPQPLRAARGRTPSTLAVFLCLPVVLAQACTPRGPLVPASATPPAGSATPARAPEIRVGLIGALGEQNVWALFSGEDYSYNDYAVRARYWPRLYDFSIPGQEFEPRLASGMPTAVLPEGAFHTATVPIRNDVRWTDGSAFTAQDVAFTVNASLRFDLGFDWGDLYDGQFLDHVEAVSPDTLRVFFRTQPGMRAWQLGVLQGPVVQAEFWAAKVAGAAEMLPTPESLDKIRALQARLVTLQEEVNKLYVETLTAQGEQAREVQANLRRQQGNLDEATNALAEEKTAMEDALRTARGALFQQDDTGEPLLGPWLPDGSSDSSSAVTNRANSSYPGPSANFDRAAYVLFPSAETAAQALAAREINLILDPSAGSPIESDSEMVSPSSSLRFLAFNTSAMGLNDSALRSALACMLDQAELTGHIGNAVALPSILRSPETSGYDPEAAIPCAGLDSARRLESAVGLLKAAGYSWAREPVNGQPGNGLEGPNGSAVPVLRLLAPDSDEQRVAAAAYIEERAAALGIHFRVQAVASDALDYMVLSSGDFDAAVMGWRVGAYPGYICDWFDEGGVFNYSPSLLPALCAELQVASELEDARARVDAMQTALMHEMPIVPLYTVAVTDELQGVGYPFQSVMDGLAGVYGAPELAFPVVP
jgi:peptide/nickel transport system substrate-binding protein